MSFSAKLFLYSLAVSPMQCAALTRLVGKEPGEVKIGLIENAADIIPNSNEWLGGFRDMLGNNGYRLEVIDLKAEHGIGLRKKLATKDVIWIGGGHTYYLRWLLAEARADEIIVQLVREGKVYAGWSAGAIVAGPTTLYFDAMGDDPYDVPKLISTGMLLTDTAIIPHMGNPDFDSGARRTQQQLQQAGFQTQSLKDNEAMVINGSSRMII